MKTKTLDFDACTQNPLNLFSDTPLLMTSIHRTQELMKSLLMQGVNAHNYQRMGTLLTYSRKIMTHYIESNRKFVDFFADASRVLEAMENNEPLPADQELDTFMESNELFNNYLDNEEQIAYLIDKLIMTSTIVLSEDQLDDFLGLPNVSLEQKKQVIDRMLRFVESNLQLSNQFREGFAQTSIQTKPNLSSALHHDIISPNLYDEIIQALDVDKDIEDEQNDDLELYKYLLEKKKQLS